jgi:quinohemoprotein ethanol dehydrogenase
MILAELTIDGARGKVIMQASKNGFFYVLDRKTGKLLSAKNYTYVNWASHIDMKTGRPVVTGEPDWYASPKNVYPSWAGGTPGIPCPTARRRTWSTFRSSTCPRFRRHAA